MEGLLEDERQYQQEETGDEGEISWRRLQEALVATAEKTEQWVGLPMPLHNIKLVVEDRHPYARALAACGLAEQSTTTVIVGGKEVTVRNRFWSSRLRSVVVVFEEDGKIDWATIPGIHHLDYDLQTLGCADAWPLEVEFTAMQTLRQLVSHRQFRQYLLTGMFLETSNRSKVAYLFRRLKPTVALKESLSGNIGILCTLCLHPLAYYSGSWAGAMCPTDDVIAHLMLMRGDEHMFWRRANQHLPSRPESGL